MVIYSELWTLENRERVVLSRFSERSNDLCQSKVIANNAMPPGLSNLGCKEGRDFIRVNLLKQSSSPATVPVLQLEPGQCSQLIREKPYPQPCP